MNLRICTWKQIGKKIRNAIALVDVFKTQPLLNAKSYSKYQTKVGCVLTVFFFLIIFVVYVNAVRSYFNLENFVIQSKSTTYNISNIRKRYISNKNFFGVVSFKSKMSGLEVDPTFALQTFMKATLIYYNFYTGQQRDYPMEMRDCAEYFQNFQNSPNLRYCLTFPDRGQLFLNADPNEQILIYFGFSCNNFILCSGNYYDSLFLQFTNFWVVNNYDVYFTTRQLDSNNNIQYIWNKFTSNHYVLGPNTINYIGVGISNSTYYIDDSVLPWRNNKTHLLQAFMAKQQMDTIPLAWIKYYGVQLIFYTSLDIYITTKYYNKIDKLLGMLGGGIFLLYLIFRCAGHRYNRYRYQMALTNNLYVTKQDARLLKISSPSLMDLILFIPFKYLNMRKWDCLKNYSYAKKLKNYQAIFEYSQYDTDIIYLLKCSFKNIRNIQLKQKFYKKENKFQPIQIRDEPQQSIKQENWFTQQEKQQMELLGVDNKQFQVLKNLHPKLKERYCKTNPVYNQFQEKNEQIKIIPTFSKIYQKPQSSDFVANIKRILTFFDIFKTSPSFTLLRNQMYGTAIGGCFTIIALILSILTFYIGFTYFIKQNNPVLSVQYYDAALNDISINIKTNQNYKFALCFINPDTRQANQLSSLFRTQMFLEVIQYDRVGSQQTIKTNEVPMITVNDMNYFDVVKNYVDPSYANCYKPPDNLILRIRGSPDEEVESYFAYRLTQYCYSNSDNYCNLTKNINRQSTLNLLNKYVLEYFMTKSSYSVLQKSSQQVFEEGLLFQQRGKLNSSVVEQILVDQFQIIDDKSKWSGTAKILASQITIQNFYNNNANILTPDDNDIFYELMIRPSGKVKKFTLKNDKFDTVFGMIGGIFLFIFTFIGFFIISYDLFVQKIYVANKIFKIKQQERNNHKYQITFLKQWMYILLYPFKYFMRNNQSILKPLYYFKRIHNSIDQVYSLQYLTRCNEIINRQLCGQQTDEIIKSLNEVYLKQKFEYKTLQQPVNRIGPLDGNPQIEMQKFDSSSGNLNLKENEIQFKTSSTKRKKRRQNTKKKNEVDKQQKQNKQEKIILQQQKIQENREQFPLKQVKISTYSKITNLFHKFLCNFDMFGTPGQISFEGSVKYGSWIGGLASLVAIILIIVIVFHFGNLYLTGQNYIVIKNIQQISSIDYYQSFKGNKNFKFAVGFISSFSPNLINISSVMSKSLLNIMVIQSIINRTNPLKHTYQQIVYPLIPCATNYLNDGTFNHYSFSIKQNIQNAYCLPDGLLLQFQGDVDSTIQKYFIASIAVNCTDSATCANNIITGGQFFDNYTIRYYLSTPLIKDIPLKYKFIEQPFLTQQGSYNQINNVTINQLVYAQNNSINWVNNPPNIETYQYIYKANLENRQRVILNNNILFKNITFNPSYTKTTYTKMVSKIDQVFGLTGGIIAFLMFIIGVLIYPFNKFKMYYSIGRRIYLTPAEDYEANQLTLYFYMIIYYSNLDKCFKKILPKLENILKLIKDVKQIKLNVVKYYENLYKLRKLLSNSLVGQQKKLMDIYFKKLIDNFDQNQHTPQKKANISPISIKQINEIIDKYQYQLSPFQKMALYNAIQKIYKLENILGEDSKIFQKYIKIQKQLQKLRNGTGTRLQQKESQNRIMNGESVDHIQQQR